MDIEEIKKEFGDCDWMRAVLNGYTVDAILWLILRVDALEQSASQPNAQADAVRFCDNCGALISDCTCCLGSAIRENRTA